MAGSKLKKNYLVTKSNALNEMRAKDMSLQELRLLIVYISRINPMDKNTVKVRLPLLDFHAIMDVQMKDVRISYYKEIARKLLSKVVDVPYKGGFMAFQLFKLVTVARENDDSPYFFELEAHEKAMPLFFDLHDHYVKYELWNALRLKGRNQLRMYEILKQYEYRGFRIIALLDLKVQLGMDADDYPQYKVFKREVLEVCQESLAKNTDLSFTFAPYSKLGRKVHELKFTITKNKGFQDPLFLDDYIDMKTEKNITVEDDDEDLNPREERLLFLADAFHGEFDMVKMAELYDIAVAAFPSYSSSGNVMALFRHFREKYNQVKRVASEGGIKNSEYGLLRNLVAQ